MLLVQLKSADVACGNATLRTRPSSGQAAFSSRLGYLELSACHSGAAFEGSGREGGDLMVASVASMACADTADLLRIRLPSAGRNTSRQWVGWCLRTGCVPWR